MIEHWAFGAAGRAHRIEKPTQGADASFVWTRLRGEPEAARAWMETEGALPDWVVEALATPETQPRATPHDPGVLLFLRGVNLAPGAEPEDMVSIRLWLEPKRVVSFQLRDLYAVRDIIAASDQGEAPADPGAFAAMLAMGLTERMEPTLSQIQLELDAIEDKIIEPDMRAERRDIADLRRRALILRRYIAPQRDALRDLAAFGPPLISHGDAVMLREAANRSARFVDGLDLVRERLVSAHESMMAERAESMNRSMLVLAVVSAVFLPLSLLTGLLGINVAGIPFAEAPWAFAAVAAVLAALAGAMVWAFKKAGLF